MEYTLHARAFMEIKRKEKATAHAKRLFRHVPVENQGRCWKNTSQWEFRAAHNCDYTDDQTALWETLRFFSEILPNWSIQIGPSDDAFELVISAIAESTDNTGLAWCHFELWRGHNHPDLERSASDHS